MAIIELATTTFDPTVKPAVTTPVKEPTPNQDLPSGYPSYPDGHKIHSPLEPATHPPSGQDHPSKQDFGLTWD